MDLMAMLRDPALHQRVLREGSALVDAEVARRSGLAAMALKAGYAAIKALRPDIIEASLDKLLPAFAPALQPFLDQALAQGAGQGAVARHFATHAETIAEALLGVTDAKAANAENPVMKRTYAALRGQAHKQTAQSVPAVGAWLDGYVAPTGGA